MVRFSRVRIPRMSLMPAASLDWLLISQGETTLAPWLDDASPDYDTEPVVASSAS